MKKYLIFLLFIILILSFFYYYKNSIGEERKQCSSVIGGGCHMYKCINSKVVTSIGGYPKCSDGSTAIQGKEVSR